MEHYSYFFKLKVKFLPNLLIKFSHSHTAAQHRTYQPKNAYLRYIRKFPVSCYPASYPTSTRNRNSYLIESVADELI